MTALSRFAKQRPAGPTQHRQPAGWRTAVRAAALAAALAGALSGCTLPSALRGLGRPADGQPGGAGEALAPDRSPVAVRDPGTAFHPGWQDGALMRVAPAPLRTLLPRLPALKALGLRGLLLERVLQGHGPGNTPAGPTDLRRIDPALGTLDDFDTLVLQAHQAGLAVLLEMPAAEADRGAGYDDALRWWLNRAVDGLLLAAPPEALETLLPRVVPLVAGYRNRLLLCPAPAEGCRGPAPLPAGLAGALPAALASRPADPSSDRHALAQALPLLLPGTPLLPERGDWGALTAPLLALRNALPPTAPEAPATQGPVTLWRQGPADRHRLVLVNPSPQAAIARVDELGPGRRFSNEQPPGGAPSQADGQGGLALALAPYSVRVLQAHRAP